jgi:PAS domain S-box-containing protein
MERFGIDFRQLGEDTTTQIIAFDAQFRYIYVNPPVERLINTPREQLLGRTIWEVAPHTEGTIYAENYRRAMRERTVIEFEAYYPPLDRWNHVRCVPESGGGVIVFARNITEERRAGFAREEALSLLNAVVNGTTDMVAAIDRERRFLLANSAVARFLGLSSTDEVLGKSDFELLPREADQAMLRRLKAIDEDLMDTGESRAFEFVAETTPTGDGPRTYLANKAPLRDPKTGEVVGLVNIIHDITERQRAERRLLRLFDSHVVGVIFWNLDTGLITDANDIFLSMVGYTREDLAAGRLDFRKMTPPEWTERNEQGVATIREKGSAPTYEKEYYRKDGSRVPILIGGTRFEEAGAEGFSFILDITERKRREERERAYLKDIFMQAPAFMATLRGPQHVFEMMNPPYHQLVGYRDILGKPVAEALPEVVAQGFISLLDQVYRTGEPFIGKDMRLVLQTTPDGPLEERFIDFAYQPLLDEERQVSGILAHGIDLTERKRLELEQERLLSEVRVSAEREALVNRIGQAIRATLDPEVIQATVAALLGEALRLDRCFYVAYDLTFDRIHVGQDWRRPDLPSIAGDYQASRYLWVLDEIFAGGTAVFNNARESALSAAAASVTESFGLRALLAVPFFDQGTPVAALFAVMTEPRVWTAAEAGLAEQVATLTRTALETARVAQRERNIALQLQAALQPELPASVPGMAIRGYYHAALEEAGVGGDFAEVFPAQGGALTCLVVADLSGKGLAAASQVAAVKNMLRFALHSDGSLAAAVTRLNQVLAEQQLLTGFATMFVGMYDAGAAVLSYVNCGQEPGLVWRAATSAVEPLSSTGPVLGAIAEGKFTEASVTLAPGDILVLFTDGMTEVGPTRQKFLEIEGLTSLFAQYCAAASAASDGVQPATEIAASILSRLIAGVEAYAGGAAAIRDDITVLVGAVSADVPLP